MALYCYRCPDCGSSATSSSRDEVPTCDGCWDIYPCSGPYRPMVRDYKAEGVGIGSGVRVSRDGLVSDQARLFLPSNDEFKGPGDPDGTKGMREWRERNQPKEGNTKPFWPGTVERKVM